MVPTADPTNMVNMTPFQPVNAPIIESLMVGNQGRSSESMRILKEWLDDGAIERVFRTERDGSHMLALSPDQNLRGMLFWLMGDLSFAYEPGRCLWLLVVLVLAGTLGARHLNVLARGELQAAIVGLPVAGFRYLIFAASALAVSLAVTTVGVIGFIGLVVPHLIRLVAGSDHRIVLPASALLGGSLLVVADTLARTLMAPRQLPVGALTAAIGVPLFLLLISRSRAYRHHR